MAAYPNQTQTIYDATQDLTRVTEVLCSRICHDLISPMGAVKNALELMSDNNMDPEVVGLLQQSSIQALDRLSIYRMAFGLKGASMSAGSDRFVEVLAGFSRTLKLQGDLDPKVLNQIFPEHQRPQACELWVYLILVISEIVPFGATIKTQVVDQTLEVQANGRLFTLKGDYAQALKDGVQAQDVTPQNIFIYYLWNSLERIGFEMTLHHDGVDCVKINLRSLVSLAQSDSLF